MEKEQLYRKATKAVLAISAGTIWMMEKALPFPLGLGGDLSDEDAEKVQKQGWLKTAAEKAAGFYKGLGKLEGAVFEGKWDDFFEKKDKST